MVTNMKSTDTTYGQITSLEDVFLENGYVHEIAQQKEGRNGRMKEITRLLAKTIYGRRSRNYRRAVNKHGECNVSYNIGAGSQQMRLMRDIFTTFIDFEWRLIIFMFFLSFFATWLVFAGIWWIIAYIHGDLQTPHLPDMQGATGWTPCVTSIVDFRSCFLFSIETQHTIGYGYRYITEECPEAIIIMSLQSVLGVLIQAMMAGIILAKLSRPQMRNKTILFSKSAVICERDGEMCFVFRVGDLRKTHIVEAHVRALIIRRKVTEEGEVIENDIEEIDVGYEDGMDRILLIWPLMIIHVIDSESPLYDVSARTLHNEQFEIIVTLEGTNESTGNNIQARSSYVPREILWGERFYPATSYDEEKGEYVVDFRKFNQSYPVAMSHLSCKEREELKKSKRSGSDDLSSMSSTSV